MKAFHLNSLILKKLPEIENLLEEYVSWQDGLETGSHLIFSDIIVEYLINNHLNLDLAKKIFNIIEELLDINDEYIDEVIQLSFLESLFYNYSQFDFTVYMGPKTKDIYQSIKRYS